MTRATTTASPRCSPTTAWRMPHIGIELAGMRLGRPGGTTLRGRHEPAAARHGRAGHAAAARQGLHLTSCPAQAPAAGPTLGLCRAFTRQPVCAPLTVVAGRVPVPPVWLGHHLAVHRRPEDAARAMARLIGAVSPLHGAAVPPLHGVARAAQPCQRLGLTVRGVPFGGG